MVSPVTLATVTIDDRTRAEASAARLLEWDATIRELLDPAHLVMRDDANTLSVTTSQQAIVLELRDAEGGVLETVTLPHDVLAEGIIEYVDIVRQIAKDAGFGGVARLAALDMAKKVTHDRAGKLLERRLRPFGIDHPTARRLFTLLLSLRVDTTRLTGVHGHRRAF